MKYMESSLKIEPDATVADMIESRKKGADKVNKMFGTNWSVHIAEEIDYSTENESCFDTVQETHVKDNEEEVEGNNNE